MDTYDVCIAWDWEYDECFIILLHQSLAEKGLSVLEVTPDTISDMYSSLENGAISFSSLVDRASDTSPEFIPLHQWAASKNIFRINPRENASKTWNKARMHILISPHGIDTPATILLPSYEDEPGISTYNIASLGNPFIIKPAHGGGGEGVLRHASTWNEVTVERQRFPDDQYLLQENIIPLEFTDGPGWFRVLYCDGNVYPCWWDTETHVYSMVTPAQEKELRLKPLREITRIIAGLSGLDMFSTEIAVTVDNRFVIVDYVNDQVDLRPQSTAHDGVPDIILNDIVATLARRVAGVISRNKQGK